MSGLLGTSLSGLMAAQRSLEIAQHNIANVNTEGYSRQRVELGTRTPEYTGEGYIGQGVNITNIARIYDQFINKQLSSSLSAYGDVDRYHQLATSVDNIMADPNTGIAPALNRFFSSMNEVANDPSSVPARQVLLSESELLVQGFNTMSGKFEEIRTLNNSQITAKIEDLNFLAKSIAEINVQLSTNKTNSQGIIQPNDLLDKQDALLSKLAEIINVTTVPQKDGTTSVFIGNGQTLVLRGETSPFVVMPSEYDSNKLEVAIQAPNGTIDVTNQISGGSLAGSLRFRDEILDPAQQKLGRLAAGLAMAVNAIHEKGFDLNGVAGTALFKFSGTEVPVVPNTGNVGNAVITANYQDVNVNPSSAGNLDYSDYSLKYAGGLNYTLTRIRDNQSITLTATATATPNIYTLTSAAANGLPGIDLTVDLTSGRSIVVGDEFLARPTYSAAQKLTVNITDPRKIAAATNIEIDLVTKQPIPKLDASNNPVLDSAGNPVYVTIDGPMPSDNRNVLALVALQSNLVMLGGSATFNDAYGQIVSSVGTLTRAAELSTLAQESLLNQAKSARESLAGVNLDEEAANLIKFQQAYQASAQSISVVKSLFDTLIGAVR
jgi:flagellar hook-associated protein 1 FlgK